MDSNSKLLDIELMNRIIHQAIPDLDGDIKKVLVYYIDIADETEICQFIDEDNSTMVEIELRDLKTVLHDIIIEDYAEFHTQELHKDLFGSWEVVIDTFASDRVMQKIMDFNNKTYMNATSKKPFIPIMISEDGLELSEYLSLDCTADDGIWHSNAEIKIDKNSFTIRNGEKQSNSGMAQFKVNRNPYV